MPGLAEESVIRKDEAGDSLVEDAASQEAARELERREDILRELRGGTIQKLEASEEEPPESERRRRRGRKRRGDKRKRPDRERGEAKTAREAAPESIKPEILKKIGVKDVIDGVGEAAFYGPKLDFMAYDVLGREWQLATIQLDFNVPERFQLEYIDTNGEAQRPIMIHRAILGSVERFMAILIEHFGGAFPTWLAPVQVALIPVAEAHEKYARELEKEMFEKGIRVELLTAEDSLGKRIRNSEKLKVPYMLVVGDNEMKAKSVTVRSYHSKDQKEHKKDAFLESLLTEVRERRLPA